jgi:hypothetical protein
MNAGVYGSIFWVLTNRRAIIFKAGWRGATTVRSFAPEGLTDIQRKQFADGTGNLVFTRDVRRDSDGDRRSTEVGFVAIHDVKKVEEMVRNLVPLPSSSGQVRTSY